MAKVVDVVGNEIQVGDAVHVVPASLPQIFRGRVTAIEAGGVVLIGGQRPKPGQPPQEQVTAGSVRFILELAVPFDPRQPICTNLVRIVVPDEDGQKKF